MALISIAMATRNSERLLAAALASIEPALGGSGLAYEIVLADGASDDSTLAIAEATPHLRVVSRRDGGIYDGMNRALAAAQGDVAIILNSDDLLLPGGLAAAWEALRANAQCAYVSGAVATGAQPETAAMQTHAAPLTVEGALFGIPVINARVFRTGLLNQIGPFLTDVGLAADRELMVRLARSGARSAIVERPLYFYRSHEGSSTISHDAAGRRRVYGAEARQAAHLITSWASDPEVVELAKCAYALADAKLRLTGAGRASELWPIAREDAPRLRHWLRAAALALRWRAKLSGA